MEQRYINILRRWLWLILLVTLLSGGLTYWVSQQQPLSYTSKARLLVGPGIDSPSPDLNALRAGAQLMQTYAEIPTTGPFLQTVIDNLALDTTPEEFRETITVSGNEETQILTIQVQSNDPVQAVGIANTLAETLVLLSPSGTNNPGALLQEQIRNQATRLEQNIDATQGVIIELEEEFQNTADVAEQRAIRDEINIERNYLSEAQDTLAQLYELMQSATINRVEILEPANTATPIATQIALKVLIGGLVGLVLSLLIIFAFEYLTDTVDDVDELARAAGVPVLGAIARHKKLKGTGKGRIAVHALPQSSTAENYRMLGTKLLYSRDYQQIRSVLISTAGPNDDSGELISNLAVVLSQTGSRVILVDANLHRPTVGQIFNVNPRSGLTDILTDNSDDFELTSIDWAPGLSVIPTGSISYDSFALLASPRMTSLLDQLETMSDLVIVVAASVLSFADSLFMTTHVDGVILVARSGKTPSDMVSNAVESLRMVGAPTLGVVLLNSRKGSSQMGRSKRSMPAPARQPVPYPVNGHSNTVLPVAQKSYSNGEEEPITVPTRPEKGSELH